MIIDPHKKFTTQNDDESEKYRRDRDRLIEHAHNKKLPIYDTSEKVSELIELIDGCLPQVASESN